MTDTKSIALNLPIYDRGSIVAFRVKFDGYCTLLKLDNEDQLKILPMCFQHRKFDSIWETFDERTTIKSAFDKLEAFIHQEEQPADPIEYFIQRKWQSCETIYDYIRDLKHRAGFITSQKKAIVDLVRLQISRGLPNNISPLVRSIDKLDDISSFLATLPRPCSSMTAAIT